MRATDDLRKWGEANPADTPPGQFAELCDDLDAKFAALVEACEAAILDARGRSGGSVYMIRKDKFLALRAALRAAKGDA